LEPLDRLIKHLTIGCKFEIPDRLFSFIHRPIETANLSKHDLAGS
jgi:hypothetical protein